MEPTLQLSSARLHLVLAERGMRRQVMTALTARLAQQGAVRLLDGGNSFDGYGLARALHQQTAQWRAALERVSVARAFTCYQMATLLAQTDALPRPTLVLDLLDTFSDENTPFSDRRRLLEQCLTQLQRLCQPAPVAVSVCLPPASQQAEQLAETLAAAVTQANGKVWSFAAAEPIPPPRLF
jgi:hypothetical protein